MEELIEKALERLLEKHGLIPKKSKMEIAADVKRAKNADGSTVDRKLAARVAMRQKRKANLKPESFFKGPRTSKTKCPRLKENKQYRTKDGHQVRIHAINTKSVDFPVVGLIYEDNEWIPRVWNHEGVCKHPHGTNNEIVAEWSDS